MITIGDIVRYRGKTERVQRIIHNSSGVQLYLGNNRWVREHQVTKVTHHNYRVSESTLPATRAKTAARNVRALDRIARRNTTGLKGGLDASAA